MRTRNEKSRGSSACFWSNNAAEQGATRRTKAVVIIGREIDIYDDLETKMTSSWIGRAAARNNEERSELMKTIDLWLVYRDFGVRKRVALDDIPALGWRAARTLPNPLENPIASAEATARLLNDIRATLGQGMQQQIADSERQRWIEVAAMYVDQKTIEVAQREREVDEIRVTLLDSAQLRHGVMVGDLKFGAYQSKQTPPPSNVIYLDGSHRHSAIKRTRR
jgi:hypothetical protein